MANNLYSGFAIQNTFMSTAIDQLQVEKKFRFIS